MSEIEKAREAREKGYGCADEIKNSDAAAEQSRRLSAQAREADLKEQMFERRVRAIVREEIEAAKSYKPQPGDAIAISDVSTRGAKLSAWTSDPNLAALICEHIDQFNALTPEQQEEHLRKQRESWVRGEMGLGLDNKRATEEGGDPHSGSGQASTREDKSPPAVEAPTAGDCPYCGGTGRFQGKFGGPGWPQCPRCYGTGKAEDVAPKNAAEAEAMEATAAGDLGLHLSHCNFGEHRGVCKYGEDKDCPALSDEWRWFGAAVSRSDDMTALARRLAEALHASFIWGWGENQSLDQRSSSALAEARKHKLIE